MALMIDRKQLAEAVGKLKFYSHSEWEALLAVVYSVPAVDAVEVVRCKDCVYFKKVIETQSPFGRCYLHDCTMSYGGFCSCVERRADNGKAD